MKTLLKLQIAEKVDLIDKITLHIETFKEILQLEKNRLKNLREQLNTVERK